ncbi:MAG: AMP-binding protein [Candidatus Omnitrophota bacterium]
MNIGGLLISQAQNSPSKPALFFNNKAISFTELKDSSFRLANTLSNKLGLKRQEKVAVYLPNSIEYVYSYLALWSVGATVVPLDFMLTEEELVSCIFHSQARILIAKPRHNISFASIKEKCPTLEKIVLCSEEVSPFLAFQQLLQQCDSAPVNIEIPDKEYAIIFYTSGTTGKPKGVLVNYLQLSAPAKAMKYFVDLGEKDTAVCALPLSHLGGLVYLQSLIYLRASVVLLERFIPFEFLKNVQRYNASCFWIVPSMYYALLQLKEFENLDLSSLQWVVCFGAPSSPEQLRKFHRYCPQADFINGWGMTETNAPTVVIPKGSQKLESIGRPAPWIEVDIFDEQDCRVPRGKIGEIVVKSWVVTDGYYKDPELTALTMRNGWFHTGDLGRFDEEGFLYIAGRKKEMIKVGGEIVFEPEVEQVLLTHPEVREVAVIGVKDELRGEVPKAFTVAKEGASLGAEDLRYFCRERLAHYKIPHSFEFRDSLPKTRSGKIDKEALRKEGYIG